MTLYPGAVWLPAPGPWNGQFGHWEPRGAGPTNLLVAHHSATTLQTLIDGFTSAGGINSAHLAIDRNDPVNDVYQFVDLDVAAFHSGDLSVNWVSWGVETVRLWGAGPGTFGYEPITDGQYRRWHEIATWFAAQAGVPLDLNFLLPHHAFTQTTCPGDVDLGRIIQGDDMLDPNDPTVQLIVQGIRNCYAEIEAVKAAVAALPAGGGTQALEPTSITGTITGTLTGKIT